MRGFAPYMESLRKEFEGYGVDFLVVYIAEAHAADEWPIRSGRCNGDRGPVVVDQPTSTTQRCALAKDFVRHFNVETRVVVDMPEEDDPFERLYAPWPLRCYIIQHAELQMKLSPNEGFYDLASVRSWLLEHT